MALLVAATHLRDPAVDTALLSCGLLMLVCPTLLALWWRLGGAAGGGQRPGRRGGRELLEGGT